MQTQTMVRIFQRKEEESIKKKRPRVVLHTQKLQRKEERRPWFSWKPWVSPMIDITAFLGAPDFPPHILFLYFFVKLFFSHSSHLLLSPLINIILPLVKYTCTWNLQCDNFIQKYPLTNWIKKKKILLADLYFVFKQNSYYSNHIFTIILKYLLSGKK